MTLEGEDRLPGHAAAVPRLGVKGCRTSRATTASPRAGRANGAAATRRRPRSSPAYGPGSTWTRASSAGWRTRKPRRRATSTPERPLRPLGPDRARAQRRHRARSAVGPDRGGLRRGSVLVGTSPPRSPAASRATTPATGRRRRCSSTSSPTATRTGARARPRTSTSGWAGVLREGFRDGAVRQGGSRATDGRAQRVTAPRARAPDAAEIVVKEWGWTASFCTDGEACGCSSATTRPSRTCPPRPPPA
jgi:hypothetical protein